MKEGKSGMSSLRLVLTRLAIIAVVSLVVVASASAQGRMSRSVEGLKILLTNDDSVIGLDSRGANGTGMYELRRALCAAGADVITVAPWGKQSGMGGRILTGGTLTVQEYMPPVEYANDCAGAPSGGLVYGVCTESECIEGSPSASPSDSVALSLNRFIPEETDWTDGPDLVLSGVNFGPNPGLAAFHSGTVSATVTAHEFGAPAIAFSEDINLECIPTPALCPQYVDASAFAVELISELRASELLKSPELLLNVNYPTIVAGETIGKPVLTVHGTGNLLAVAYLGGSSQDGAVSYDVDFIERTPETRKNADTTALDNNNISIAPMDGDWSAAYKNHDLKKVVKRLKKVVKRLQR